MRDYHGGKGMKFRVSGDGEAKLTRACSSHSNNATPTKDEEIAETYELYRDNPDEAALKGRPVYVLAGVNYSGNTDELTLYADIAIPVGKNEMPRCITSISGKEVSKLPKVIDEFAEMVAAHSEAYMAIPMMGEPGTIAKIRGLVKDSVKGGLEELIVG